MSGEDLRLQRCRARLAAALRALAEAPQLAVSFSGHSAWLDAASAHLPDLQQPPADWTGWRALADRLALRYRYPLPFSRPLPDRLAPLVEALWQARAEAMGARLWPGVAHNLQTSLADEQACVPVLPERLRLLVHHALGVFDLPPALQRQATRWQAELLDSGINLAELAAALESPRRYAALALQVARRLAPADSAPAPTARQRRQAGEDEAPLARGLRRAGRSGHAEGVVIPPAATEAARDYRIYSRAWDQTLHPTDLAGPDELARLRQRLDAELAAQRRLVTRLARRLEQRLQARSPTGWQDQREQGWLDPRRLHRLIVDPGWPFPYRERASRSRRDTVVCLLLDNSASMRGQRIRLAALCADLLPRSLERCGVKVEVLGFTTADWDGGAAAAAWREAGRPPNPGRLAVRRHIIYKSADQPWRQTRNGLGLLLRDDILKENLDGEALEWAAQRLLKRPERRRILLLLGDGAPLRAGHRRGQRRRLLTLPPARRDRPPPAPPWPRAAGHRLWRRDRAGLPAGSAPA
ncbi:MAG: hypothetical protein GX093_13680 [Xanthomonadaceae bacterium]|nr:hypothetical protein [Xanthomonadaceae bacterium]